MKIVGIDFTSAPGRAKPLTCVIAEILGSEILVSRLDTWTSFASFEGFLESPGPWVAAIDFPFGQSATFVRNIGWPAAWADYVSVVAGMTSMMFQHALIAYRAPRAKGDKHHKRETDLKARSQSPQTLDYTPVGKMFFQGAPRLLKSPASVYPCCPRDGDRVVLEGYPKLVAKRWTDGAYKHDDPRKQTKAHRDNRRRIVEGLRTPALRATYELVFDAAQDICERAVADGTGDSLDAVLCAVQAAWSFRRRDFGWGVVSGYADEGWIVDPGLR